MSSKLQNAHKQLSATQATTHYQSNAENTEYGYWFPLGVTSFYFLTSSGGSIYVLIDLLY